LSGSTRHGLPPKPKILATPLLFAVVGSTAVLTLLIACKFSVSLHVLAEASLARLIRCLHYCQCQLLAGSGAALVLCCCTCRGVLSTSCQVATRRVHFGRLLLGHRFAILVVIVARLQTHASSTAANYTRAMTLTAKRTQQPAAPLTSTQS